MHNFYFSSLRLNKKELFGKGIIFAAISFCAIESTFSFTYNFLHITSFNIISEIIISFIFGIDLIYNYTHNQKTERHKPPTMELEHKNNSLFNQFIDIVAIIPIDLIIFMSNISLLHPAGHLLRLLKLLKIAKIYTIIPLFSGLNFRIRILLILSWSLIAIHWIACGWYLVSNVNGANLWTIYNKSLYWAVTTLTTIGYGDITPTTNVGRLYTMVIMILGVGVYGIVIGNVTRMIYMNDRHKEKIREKISDLTLMMKHYNIPLKLQRDVFSYYNLHFTKRLSENDAQIISELPIALKSELQVFMNVRLIQSVSLFQSCTLECLKEIASNLEQLSFSPGKKIISKGEIGQEMYIVYHGTVEIRGENNQIISTYSEGQAFGQIALLQETTRTFDVRASTYCDLFKLNKETFLSVIEKNPSLLKTLERSMRKRHGDR